MENQGVTAPMMEETDRHWTDTCYQTRDCAFTILKALALSLYLLHWTLIPVLYNHSSIMNYPSGEPQNTEQPV